MRVRVIGCGNPDAGDDAVGLVVVRRVRERLAGVAGVEVVEAGAALNVIHLLEGVQTAVVVDAVRAPRGGREPGTIVRVEAGPEGLPTDLRSSLSSHGLGLAEAVGLAAALDRAPRIVFVGVEVGDVVAGHDLSPRVEAALGSLVEMVVAEVAQPLRPA